MEHDQEMTGGMKVDGVPMPQWFRERIMNVGQLPKGEKNES